MNRRRVTRWLKHLFGPFLSFALLGCWFQQKVYGTSTLIPNGRLKESVLMGFALVVLLLALSAKLRFRRPSARRQNVSSVLRHSELLVDIQLSVGLLAAFYSVSLCSENLFFMLSPLLFLLLAFSGAFLLPLAGFLMLALVWILESSMMMVGDAGEAPLLRIGFATLFFGLHAFFIKGTVKHLGFAYNKRLKKELSLQRQSAREFRMIGASLRHTKENIHNRDVELGKLQQSAVVVLQDSIQRSITLLQSVLSANTVAVLWLNEQGNVLKIKGLKTSQKNLIASKEVPITGVIAALVRDQKPCLLPSTRQKQLSYYESHSDATATSFIGVPIMEGKNLRGVLVADRLNEFAHSDLDALEIAAGHVIKLVESEQLFSTVERSKFEHEQFFYASSLLCQALTLDQVVETAFDAALAIVDYDLAIVSLYDKSSRRHRIQAFRVPPECPPMVTSDDLANVSFKDNAGLVSMVVKNRHYLPAGGERRDLTVPVFTKRLKFRGAESLVVYPLISADRVIGTLSLFSRKPRQFRKELRAMLGVTCAQVAVSLQNALMYRQMEKMATTDGLTGLTNHRTFQERFSELLERSKRHERSSAVLICDVDHFKSVNDTYGHPLGDEVLRQVSNILSRAVRKIDTSARYGGEEFALLLDAVDVDGALGLAERVRQEVSDMVIQSDQGPFKVTMSIGVALFPDHGSTKELLIEKADDALYRAKESGRNQVQLAVKTQREKQAS